MMWRKKLPLLCLVLWACSFHSHAIDNPDAPDFALQFEQRAQSHEDKIDRQTNNADIASATGEYAKFLDAELNQAYQQLQKKLNPQARQKLKISQRAWLKFNQAETDFIASNWTNDNFGSSSAISRAQYQSAMVKSRVTALLDYLKNYQESVRLDAS